MDWQPIETAPKDGSTVILANEHEFRVAFWSDGLGEWMDDNCGDLDNAHPLTHWALPKLPTKGE